MFEQGHEIAPEEWTSYFAGVMPGRGRRFIHMDVERDDMGRVNSAHGLLLESLLYDRHDDEFEVVAMRPGPNGHAMVRHFISHPSRVEVDSPRGIVPTRISIEDAEGTTTHLALAVDPALSA